MSSSSEVVAIVLARGGSKGIPRKNLAPLAGRPLIEYTLVRACEARRVSRLAVSTDSHEIAEVSRRLGAEVVWRPSELCTDHATSESALVHCLDEMSRPPLSDPRLVVFLQPTSPLRPPGLIDGAVALIEDDGADSLFSAGPLQGLAWRAGGDGVVPVSYDPRSRPRRQDAPEYLAENGSVYVFKPWVLRELSCRLGGRITVLRMPAMDSFEVDEPDDLPLVEFLLRRRYPDLVAD